MLCSLDTARGCLPHCVLPLACRGSPHRSCTRGRVSKVGQAAHSRKATNEPVSARNDVCHLDGALEFRAIKSKTASTVVRGDCGENGWILVAKTEYEVADVHQRDGGGAIG